MTDCTPFFIVGSSRSGTTLLRLMLAGHSRLHIPPETWFIEPLVAQFPLADALSPNDLQLALNVMTRHRRWPDMEISADELERQASNLVSPKLADIINIVYRHHLHGAGKLRIGDKTPRYVRIVPKLCALYPGAKFIHLIRDGRDVAISFIDAKFNGRPYHGKKFEWTQAVQKGLSYRNSSYAHQIMEVRYEELVTNLRPTVRKICAFLGENFEPQLLEWTDRTYLVPAREKRIHMKLDKPLQGNPVAVWRRKLSVFECFVFEACLHRELLRLGYELRFDGVAWRALLKGASWAFYVMAPLLNRGIPFLKRRQLLPRKIYF
jgi:Sulfotransferase family